LFLLAIFISRGAFREFHTIWDVLAIRPPSGEKYWILEWADDILGDPVFPEMFENGPVLNNSPSPETQDNFILKHQNRPVLDAVWPKIP